MEFNLVTISILFLVFVIGFIIGQVWDVKLPHLCVACIPQTRVYEFVDIFCCGGDECVIRLHIKPNNIIAAYRGDGTVWRLLNTGERVSTDLELQLCDIWTREYKWKSMTEQIRLQEKWFSSEFCAAALEAGGVKVLP